MKHSHPVTPDEHRDSFAAYEREEKSRMRRRLLRLRRGLDETTVYERGA